MISEPHRSKPGHKSQSTHRMGFRRQFLLLFFWCLTAPAGGSREERFIRINPRDTMSLGFFHNIGFQLILPTLAPFDSKRSFVEGFDNLDMPFYDPSEDEVPEELLVDVGYMKQAQRLVFVFEYLGIYTVSCQERITCEMAAETNFYHPLSEVILRDMKQRYGKVSQSKMSLMWRYITAAKLGLEVSAQECGQAYRKCPRPAYQLLNMSVIKVWQYIASKTNMKFLGIR